LTPTNKIILVAGDFDQISTPEDVRELHHAWRGSHFANFPQGHVGYTLMPASFQMAKQLWGNNFGYKAVSNAPC
jgi:hypothetical protein